MLNVGPQALAIGAATAIKDPAQGGGNPSVACQIQNSSAYQLSVLAAGDVLSIQPFTAQTIEISGQPITVTPLAGASGTCSVTFVFLLGAPASTGVQLSDGTWVETPPQQDGPLTAAAITAAAAPPGSVYGPISTAPTAGTITLSGIVIPPNARTVLISLKHLVPLTPIVVTNVQVLGSSTAIAYYNAPPYLGVGPATGPNNTNALIVVPISGVIDSAVQIVITTAQTLVVQVSADSSEYPESVFYNGTVQTASQGLAGAGTILLATGPLRLLTSNLITNANTTEAFITINGVTGLVVAGATAGLDAVMGLSYPPNTIVPAGAPVVLQQAGAGGSVAAISYAYP